MARLGVSAVCLAIQSFLMIAVGCFALLQPGTFIAGTDDMIGANPDQLMRSLRSVTVPKLPIYLTRAHRSSMMSLTAGGCYAIAASHPAIRRRTLLMSVALRVLATITFSRGGPRSRNVALYEATWALLNLAAVPFA